MKKNSCEKVSKDVGVLGRFYSVENMYKKGFMKPSKSNPKNCILTKKGRKELKKKKEESPYVSGSKKI